MKQFDAKRQCCHIFNFKKNVTILQGVVIFLFFIMGAGATAGTTTNQASPGVIASVNTGCAASFTDSISDLEVFFTSTSSDTDANTEYTWNFGDMNSKSISHKKNPRHLYASGGSYTVCLTIKNKALGCYDSVCHDITITQCQAGFNAVANNLKVSFTNTSTGVDANTLYDWTFGDGSISHLVNPTHVYKTPVKVCSVPIMLTNNQNSATPAGFQQQVTVNSSLFTANELAGLENVEFTTGSGGTGSVLGAWLESGASNASTNSVWWINLDTSIIPANGALTIYMNFMSSNIMSASGPTGEAPQLSGTYGQYDNGTLVFPEFYDNFSGTSLASKWTLASPASVSVNNGATVTWNSNSNWFGIYTNTFSGALGNVAESYMEASNTNQTGACINTSGTNGNGINNGSDGVDAQLTGPSGSGYAFGTGGSCTTNPNANNILATATPSSNTFYVMSFFMLNTPVMQLNYGAFENVTAIGSALNAISATSEVGLGCAQNSSGTFQWFRVRANAPSSVMPGANVGSLVCEASAKYNVCLTIKNSTTGCESTTCDSVTVVAPVNVCGASFTNTTGSPLVIFTNTSTGTTAFTKYTWTFGDGGISHEANPKHKYAITGMYNVCLYIKDTSVSFCDTSYCNTITVSAVNVCGADFTNTTGSQLVTFTNTSTGTTAFTKYSWTFGDGGISHGANPKHKYAITGMYNVCLYIKDTSVSFCDTSYCNTITVSAVNVCGADFTNTTGSQLVTFTNTSTGTTAFTKYSWTFGDGGISHEANPKHKYALTGMYNVCLNIIDTSVSFCDSTFCSIITVSDINVCGADFTSSTKGLTATFTNASTGTTAFTKYTWNFGDNNSKSISHDVNPVHKYDQSGKYQVCLTITDTSVSFCDSTFCDSVTVSNVSVCGADFTTLTNGLAAAFTNTSTGTTKYTKYTWNFGDSNSKSISHSVNPVHSYDKSGRYEVCLTVTDTSVSFCDTTFCDSVTVTDVSVCGADFTTSTDGLTATFTNTSTGTTKYTKYTWNFGDKNSTSISHDVNPVHKYLNAGTYEVCLTISDTSLSFCDTTFCDSVTVNSLVSECVAKFTYTNVKGQGIAFTDHSTGTTSATQYRWNLGDGTVLKNERDPVHRYKQGGVYEVCLTITDSTETYCNSTYCDSVDFIATGIDQLSFPGSSLYYDASASQLVVNWTGNDNITIQLVDIVGRIEQNIYTGNLNTGLYRFNVNTSSLTDGIYLIHVTANDGNRSWKIFVLPH